MKKIINRIAWFVFFHTYHSRKTEDWGYGFVFFDKSMIRECVTEEELTGIVSSELLSLGAAMKKTMLDACKKTWRER